MDDSAIVEMLFMRDETAVSACRTKYERYLMKIAYNILADMSDSEEAVNDTYFAAWESIPPNRPTVLSLYLGKLTRRIAIDIFRKRTSAKRRKSECALSLEELEECLVGDDTTENRAESKLLGEAISRFLMTQSCEKRALFVGRYYYMDSLKNAAAYTGMSEGKAKTVLFRLRAELRIYLEKEGFYI